MGWSHLNRAEPIFKLTLPGLCGAILATTVVMAGLDAAQREAKQKPTPHAMRAAILEGARAGQTGAVPGRSPGKHCVSVARPTWVKRVGHLRLVKWGDARTPLERGPETVIIRDGHGRTVARITGPRVAVEWIGDLADDGIPEVILQVSSGVCHAGYVYYVYSAGPLPRCLLAYDKENVMEDSGLWPEFEVKDLDGDGRPEIVTTYDGFADWNYGVERWQTCYAGSARVPLVLGFQRGRLVDVTREYRPWLRKRLAEAKQGFLEDLHEAGQAGLTDEHAQRMIEYYSVALLLYDRATARRMVTRLLPQGERSFFLAHCGLIERALAARWKRYAYPPAYSRAQAFASEAYPPGDPADDPH